MPKNNTIPDYKYADTPKKCRLCEYYGEQFCSLFDQETRGTYTCGMWMPIFSFTIDMNHISDRIKLLK